MNIRKASAEDVDILIKLRLEYLKDDFGGLNQEDESAIRRQLASYLPEHIGHDFLSVMAQEDNQVVSIAFLVVSEKPANPVFITGRTGTILNVFTYPAFRKQGYATKVLNTLIEDAKRMQLSFIELSASPAGKPLYEKLGFTVPQSKYTAMRLNLY